MQGCVYRFGEDTAYGELLGVAEGAADVLEALPSKLLWELVALQGVERSPGDFSISGL